MWALPMIRCLSLAFPSRRLCWWCLAIRPPAPGMQAGGPGRLALALATLRSRAVVIFVWRSQGCETGVASHLSVSLGSHRPSGSCVAVDVTINIQKIECFLVLNLRSHLLYGAKNSH